MLLEGGRGVVLRRAMVMQGQIHQINISSGGVPKLPIKEARVGSMGLEGDWQTDRKHHGGPERAVCLFSLEVIRRLQSEGHPIVPGSVGENLTIEGLDWSRVVPGARLVGQEGRFELEVVSYAAPCSTIRNSFADLNSKRIKQELHPSEARTYARVVRDGVVRTGDLVELVSPA